MTEAIGKAFLSGVLKEIQRFPNIQAQLDTLFMLKNNLQKKNHD